MQTIEHEIRGIPYSILKLYLQDMGGHAEKRNLMVGDGWRATLKRMDPFRIGSLEVGQTRVTFEIEDALVDDFMARFAMKTLRAGA